MFVDFYEDNKKVIWLGISGISILFIAFLLTNPIIILEVTSGITLLISLIVILGGLLLEYIISIKISLLLFNITSSFKVLKLYKIFGIIGTVLAAYSIIMDIVNIEWQSFGISSFYHSLAPNNNGLKFAKSIFDEEVLPNFVQVLKAITVNIGSILWSFLVNYVPPFCWIFTTVGLFKNV